MPFKKYSIAILGSTGSIGKTSLKILEQYPNKFKINLISGNSNKVLLEKQIKKFLPRYVIINNLKVFNYFKKIKFKKKILFFNSVHNFNKSNKIKFDKVILGISSIHGLDYAFAFIKFSKKLLIANKETIVCGGNFFLQKAKKLNCEIISIDSEHYCLSSVIKNFNLNQIYKIYLTASGGPFLKKNINQIAKIDVGSALKHPNWKMGKKISIDSATMANKGLEVIEASFLFNLNPEIIKIKIHKESKVHSIIVLKNGLTHLVSHNTSMTIPIKNSLLDFDKVLCKKNFFTKKKQFNFTFDEINLKKFKMLSLAYKALKYGQRACIFYNVINDYLVDLYLNKKIFYYEIHAILNKIINNKKLIPYFRKKVTKLNDIYATINFAKNFANNQV